MVTLSLSQARASASYKHNYKLDLHQMRQIISSLLIGRTSTQLANKTSATKQRSLTDTNRRGKK